MRLLSWGGGDGIPERVAADRWRTVWYEKGQRRQCEAATEDRLAARLEKVTERLATGAPNLERPGADLVAFYLSPGRLPVQRQPPRQGTRIPSGGGASGSPSRSSARSGADAMNCPYSSHAAWV